jgi:hypothetical protein
MNKPTNLFSPVPDAAAILLMDCKGSYTDAKAVCLKLIQTASRKGGCYGLRRHYCAIYVHLLIQEPQRFLKPPTTSFLTFKLHKHAY